MDSSNEIELSALEWAAAYQTTLADLLARLDDERPQVRADAVSSLWDYVEPEAMERLLDLAQHDPAPAVRCKAISGLGRYMWEAAIIDFDWDDPYRDDWYTAKDYERLYNFLYNVYANEQNTLDERRYAVEALSFLYDEPVPTLIRELYARPEKEAKISALFSMGRHGTTRWLDILEREIWSRDKEIRIEALEAAAEMHADALGKDLWRMTYDHDKKVMMAATWALGQTGWEEGFDRLDELTMHHDPKISELADAALEEWLLFNQINSEEELELDELDDNESDWMLQ